MIVNPSETVVRAMQSNPGNFASVSGSTGKDLQPLINLLRPDGSLDLDSGFNGSLDPAVSR